MLDEWKQARRPRPRPARRILEPGPWTEHPTRLWTRTYTERILPPDLDYDPEDDEMDIPDPLGLDDEISNGDSAYGEVPDEDLTDAPLGLDDEF